MSTADLVVTLIGIWSSGFGIGVGVARWVYLSNWYKPQRRRNEELTSLIVEARRILFGPGNSGRQADRDEWLEKTRV